MPQILLKPILPKGRGARLDLERVRAELSRDLDAEKAALIRDFERTTTGWDTDVSFGARKYLRADQLSIAVYPTGPGARIWRFVEEGTRPHVIKPRRRGGTLAFKSKYRARTRPGSLRSGVKLSYGSTVHAKIVHHPGTRARDFTGQIARKHQANFRRLCENGLRRALR